MKKSIVMAGAGKLAHVVADAWIKGYLTDYEITGVYSRTQAGAVRLADKIKASGPNAACLHFEDIPEILESYPDYIVEAASPAALKEIAVPALRRGISVIALSIGALADENFYRETHDAAISGKSKLYLASGAIGGFDVLRTISLMGDLTVAFDTEKGPDSLKHTPVYDESLQEIKMKVFEGNASEAINLFPTKVNVAVAASLATIGPDQTRVTITSVPGFVGDTHHIEAENEAVKAVIEVYSKTAEIAGWSAVNILRNIMSPIVF